MPQPGLSAEPCLHIYNVLPQRHPREDQYLWIYPTLKVTQSSLSQFLQYRFAILVRNAYVLRYINLKKGSLL